VELKEYIPIMFNGGSYGSFLHFVLDNLNKEKIDNLPFTLDNGNSHNFIRNTLQLSKTNEFVVNRQTNSKFIKYHPKQYKEQMLSNEITRLANLTNKSILIYPSKNDMLLVINNFYFKIWNKWFEDGELNNDPYEKQIFFNNLHNNWDIPKNTNFNDIPRWIQREFLSFYLFPAWNDHYEWNMLEWYTHPNLHIITVSDLLYNFKKTIETTAIFCEIGIKNIQLMTEVHKKMLGIQSHLNKDTTCSNILNNYINGTVYHYKELSVIDEAWIQYELRNRGYEIKCDKLDKFPTNTNRLKKITYRV
jgi:hypothetical protein